MKNNSTKATPSKTYAGIATIIIFICLSFSINSYAQPPCNGIPEATNIIAFQNPVCPGVNFILLYSPTESGITYQWFSSPDGNNYNPIPGAVQQQILTSILQPTYFELRITCTQSGQSEFTQPILINVIQPVIQYPSSTVVLNEGESTHPDNTGYVTFTTECCEGSVTYSDATSSNCCQIVITRTWTIVDCHGEGIQFPQTIIVLLDATAPVITCTPLGSGACNTTPTPDPGSVTVTDECPGSLSVVTSEAAGPGCIVVTTFTWTATDQCGHSSTCTQTYSRIMDAIPPVIVCPAPVALACNVTPSPDVAAISATDNCGTPEISLIGSSSSSAGCLITYVYTWRATDACGNFADCNQVYSSIHDVLAPVIICPGPTTLPCNTAPSPSASLITATDDCGTPAISLLGSSSSTVGCLTTTTFTWRATDACGNFADCDQIFTSIFDLIAPVIHCPDPVDLPCNTTPTPSASLITATDNCGTPEISFVGSSSGTAGCFVTYVFIWRATDACGNIADCAQILTSKHDLTPPVITCPVPDTFPCNLLPFIDPSLISATDNCGIPDITYIDSRTSSNGCWVTLIETWKATDACGNFSFCEKLTTALFDAIAPEINCNNPVSIDCNTVPTPDASDIEATDNCGVAPEITLVGSSSSTIDCVKEFVFTWRATDVCGNYRECNQILTSIFDDIEPFIECPEPTTLACNTTPVPDESLISTADNCGDPFITLQGTSFSDIGCLRIFEFTWRATDDCGNFSECTQVYFSDFDEILPVIICPDPDTLCNATPTPSISLISATDNCGFVDITYVGTTTATVGCVTTYNFTWKATDDCGNFSTCIQVIYAINDLDDPEIFNCPNTQSVPNDEGMCGAIVTWTPPTATDNCGLLSFTSTHAPNSFFPVGQTTVTYTAIDLCGHIETCVFDIYVDDLEPPWNMHCPGVIIKDTDLGECSAIVTWNATATDNCGIASIVGVPESGSEFPVGVTPVIVTATDIYGNTWTCEFNVHINDHEKPVFENCPNDIIKIVNPGFCIAGVFWPDIIVTDNCELESVILTPDFNNIFPVGVHNLTYTATDIHGNVQTCKFKVTVIDDTPPVINNCPADIIVNTEPGLCRAQVSWAEPTAVDNCGVLTFTCNFNSGDDFPAGEYIVIYTATDIHGNVSTCTFIIDVDDIEDPFILSHDIVTCEPIVFYDFIIGDNCDIDRYSYNPPSGSVFPVGTTSVYVEAWDIHNNMTFRFFDVTVLAPPSPIDSVIASSYEVCAGDSFLITAYFDTLGAGGTIKLYKDECAESAVIDSSNEVDNVWFVEVKAGPNSAGIETYYVRIEGYCDTTECVPISIIKVPCPPIAQLHLNLFLQGFYTGGGLMDNSGDGGILYLLGISPNPLDADTIEVSAVKITGNTYSIYSTQKVILKTNGEATVNFDAGVIPGNSYYLRIKHRNSVETWSKTEVLLSAETTYSFISSPSQAHGDNEIETFDNFGYAIYTGDIDHNNSVDASDFLELDPVIQSGDSGYLDGDLTGDVSVDASDFLMLDPNIQNGVGASTP